MAQRSEVICPFSDQTMNEVCQSGSWDGGGLGENDQNWEEVKGQLKEGCRGAGEMDGKGPLSQRSTQQVCCLNSQHSVALLLLGWLSPA